MVVRREKKSKYLRGYRTMGWGRVGQHRRSGTKGGRGHAGYHKHYWTWVVKYAPDWFGKHGFTRPPEIVPKPRCINVGEIDEKIEELVKMGLAKVKDDAYEVNIVDLGYTKLLGRGRVSKKLIIKALEATESAIEKVKALGGEVILLKGKG